MYQLIVRKPATAMANEAYHWYEQQQDGLGEQFLKDLDISFEKLIHNPLLYSKTYKNFRKVAVGKFPFVVVYKILKDQVIIYSIFHTSRKPDKEFRK